MNRRGGSRSPSMAAARFCSKCGARLKVKRTTTLPFRSFCQECSSSYHRIRLMLIAVPVFCVTIGFAIGHYTSAREPFYLIGTPVDLSAPRVPPSSNRNGDPSSGGNATLRQPEQLVISPSAPGSLCGAQTRSGKPCRRKVKGGGYCWQHRVGLPTTK
jgi:hypothetical protein